MIHDYTNVFPNTKLVYRLYPSFRGLDYRDIPYQEDLGYYKGFQTGTHYRPLPVLTPSSLSLLNFKLLNLKYIISNREFIGPFQLLRETPSYLVYRFEDYLPRAYFVGKARYAKSDDECLDMLNSSDFDMKNEVILLSAQQFDVEESKTPGSVAIKSLSPNNIKILTKNESPSILVMSEIWYPGWNASLNGKKVPLLRANYCIRAVHVPPGDNLIELKYRPALFFLGLFISLITFSGLLIFILVRHRFSK